MDKERAEGRRSRIQSHYQLLSVHLLMWRVVYQETVSDTVGVHHSDRCPSIPAQ
jgi:hypothetical protein